jgi:hypothetical protein
MPSLQLKLTRINTEPIMKYPHIFALAILCLLSACFAEEQLVLEGQLLEEDGETPLAHQNVYSDSVGTKVAETDAMGFFKYPVKNGAKYIHVLPWSREIVGRSVFIDVEDFKDSVFKIVVERGVALQVKVVAADGTPIQNAEVSWQGSGGASGKSDAKGFAQLGRISRYKNGHIRVRVPGCKDATSKKNLCAASYVDRIITITVPDYGNNIPVNDDKDLRFDMLHEHRATSHKHKTDRTADTDRVG